MTVEQYETIERLIANGINNFAKPKSNIRSSSVASEYEAIGEMVTGIASRDLVGIVSAGKCNGDYCILLIYNKSAFPDSTAYKPYHATMRAGATCSDVLLLFANTGVYESYYDIYKVFDNSEFVSNDIDKIQLKYCMISLCKNILYGSEYSNIVGEHKEIIDNLISNHETGGMPTDSDIARALAKVKNDK